MYTDINYKTKKATCVNALKVAEATIVRLERNGSAKGTLDVIRAAIANAERSAQ